MVCAATAERCVLITFAKLQAAPRIRMRLSGSGSLPAALCSPGGILIAPGTCTIKLIINIRAQIQKVHQELRWIFHYDNLRMNGLSFALIIYYFLTLFYKCCHVVDSWNCKCKSISFTNYLSVNAQFVVIKERFNIKLNSSKLLCLA